MPRFTLPLSSRRPARPLALLLAGLALAACQRADAGADAAPQRVVSVSKQINEMMYAIGAQDVIVARDLSSIYPPAITEKPSVGYHRALSAEGIISMRPTLFLTDGNHGPEAVIEQLRKVGIPILTVESGGTVEGAQAMLTRLGTEFHREAQADSVLAEWRAGMQQLFADTAQWSAQRKPRVLLMHFGHLINNYLAVNRGSPADQMLAWAGGVNAIDSVGGMTRLTPELIAKAAPDVVIATDFGFDRVGGARQFAEMPGIALTPAGKSGRVYRIGETEVIYFGPRTPATVRKLATLIHATDPAAAVAATTAAAAGNAPASGTAADTAARP
ncbi:MAG TPA: ABC transporter substrate-binding protein [Gemmatimonadaceae bacterium]|nr:ABC transporter substrate-binding protein [Gemmatimonadaceae bacterium]